MSNLCALVYSVADVLQKRAEVTRRFMAVSPNVKTPVISRIAASDVRLLFDIYDEIFFERRLSGEFPGQFRFSLSPRLTRSAGKTLCPRNIAQLKPGEAVLEIRMGLHFFFQFDAVRTEKTVGGITAHSSLEAFQLVLEHELCHVLEFITFHASNCNGKRFRTIARNLFGHTESYHRLPTQRQIAAEKYGLKIGASVAFRCENKQIQGMLYRIHKRAIVMVKDKKGNYVDKQGNRYTKYSVPVGLLELK